jgi:dUTP pyrophosphatase
LERIFRLHKKFFGGEFIMKVKLTHPNAKLPFRANPTDAGADLFATETVTIKPHSNYFMDLGIQTEIPVGFAGFIFARSGLGSKFGIRPRNCVGVIDCKYRNNIGIMIENHSDVEYMIIAGDRIAQFVILPIGLCDFEEVNELDMSDDRSGGFGSTGTN